MVRPACLGWFLFLGFILWSPCFASATHNSSTRSVKGGDVFVIPVASFIKSHRKKYGVTEYGYGGGSVKQSAESQSQAFTRAEKLRLLTQRQLEELPLEKELVELEKHFVGGGEKSYVHTYFNVETSDARFHSTTPRVASQVKLYGGERMRSGYHNYGWIYARHFLRFMRRSQGNFTGLAALDIQPEFGGASAETMIVERPADIDHTSSLKRSIILAEIGVLAGTGLAMWSSFLPALSQRVLGTGGDGISIAGFDLVPKFYQDFRETLIARGAKFEATQTEVYEFDQLTAIENSPQNQKSMRTALETLGAVETGFDIVIDDGWHTWESAKNTMEAFLDRTVYRSGVESYHEKSTVPRQMKNFVYIIEDQDVSGTGTDSFVPRLLDFLEERYLYNRSAPESSAIRVFVYACDADWLKQVQGVSCKSSSVVVLEPNVASPIWLASAKDSNACDSNEIDTSPGYTCINVSIAT